MTDRATLAERFRKAAADWKGSWLTTVDVHAEVRDLPVIAEALEGKGPADAVRDALEFYAEPKNWLSPSTGFARQYDPDRSPVQSDRGERAKAALSGCAGPSTKLRRLVIAARVVAFQNQGADALRELDQASEEFASVIPWDDEPEASALSQMPATDTAETEPLT